MSELVSISKDMHLLQKQLLTYLARLPLLCKRVYRELCEQCLHISHVKLQRDVLRRLERSTSYKVDGLQRDTKDPSNGEVDGSINCR